MTVPFSDLEYQNNSGVLETSFSTATEKTLNKVYTVKDVQGGVNIADIDNFTTTYGGWQYQYVGSTKTKVYKGFMSGAFAEGNAVATITHPFTITGPAKLLGMNVALDGGYMYSSEAGQAIVSCYISGYTSKLLYLSAGAAFAGKNFSIEINFVL